MSEYAWGTADEIAFIRGLGLWYNGQRMSRISLLRGYIEGARNRADWGATNSRESIDYARRELDMAIREAGEQDNG